MKKIIVSVVVMLLVVSGVKMVSKVGAQDEMQVSPREWVLGSAGIEVIDVHIATSLTLIDRESVAVSVEGIGDYVGVSIPVENVSVGSDNRGELVVKFVPDLSSAELPDGIESLAGVKLRVRVEGRLIDGGILEETFEGVEIKVLQEARSVKLER